MLFYRLGMYDDTYIPEFPFQSRFNSITLLVYRRNSLFSRNIKVEFNKTLVTGIARFEVMMYCIHFIQDILDP